jgi:hypothetical protein
MRFGEASARWIDLQAMQFSRAGMAAGAISIPAYLGSVSRWWILRIYRTKLLAPSLGKLVSTNYFRRPGKMILDRPQHPKMICYTDENWLRTRPADHSPCRIRASCSKASITVNKPAGEAMDHQWGKE